MKRTGKIREVAVMILVLAVLFVIMLNSSVYYLRGDMTDEKIFTISEVSEKLFEDIEDRVDITYYVSEKLEKYSSIPTDVRDLLGEYRAHAKGRVNVDVVDPVKAGVVRQVEALGLVPRQIEIVEQNEKSYTNIYTGIVIRYLDSYEVLPFVVSTETLEYEITKTIRDMVNPRDKSVAVMLGDAGRTLDKDYNAMFQQLTSMFNAVEVAPGEGIDPGTDVLLVFGNHDISEEDLLPIEDYLMAGGNALFCVDGVYVDMFQNLQATAEEDSPLLDMIAHYGVTVERKLVLDRYARDFRLPTRVFGQVAWQILGPYPHWVSILPANSSEENPVTARLNGLDLLWPSPLRLEEVEGVDTEVLLRSSDKAWTMEAPFMTDPYRGDLLMQSAGGETESYNLGVLLKGNIPRYTGEEDIVFDADSRIIVLGDADFASNMLQYSNSMYNLLFLENTIEWLAHDEALLEIKTRPLGDTRLNSKDPETARSIYVTAQIVNVALIPLIILAIGVLRARSRRQRRKEVHS